MALLSAATLSLPAAEPASSVVSALEPVTPAQIEQAIQRGVQFMLEHQNPNGSWGSPRRTKGLNIYAPVPGAHQAFRAATTALGICAMIETGAAEQSTEAQEALEKAERWLLENLPHVRRANQDALYNVWAHGYGIQALVMMYQRTQDPTLKERIEKEIHHQFTLLRHYESVDGGWGYYDFRYHTARPTSWSTSFVTASILMALDYAREAGFDVPMDLVERGLASIRRQRKPDFSYAYAEPHKWRPMRGINRPGGSLGRSQACNIALRRWGDTNVTDQVIETWLDRLAKRNGWLSIGRKRPVPHESWFQVAGYFFYFGHYYAGLCLEELPAAKQKPYKQHLAAILVQLQEKDGSWWDYPFYDYHQPYGTAFALMTLQRCR